MVPVITEEQKNILNEKGFFVLENVFSQWEMDELAKEIENLQKVHVERLILEQASSAESGVTDISRPDEITFTCHLAEQNEAIRAFCKRPEFVAITADLLGPDIDLYWNQSVFKLPEGEREFPWHQDDAYCQVAPSPYLTLWLALNDATPENGCISAMPGSHKNGLVPHTQSPIGLVCHSSEHPDQGLQVPVKAGSLAVFWSMTFHKSGVNRSQGMRKAYIIQCAKAGLRRVDSGELIPDLIPIVRFGQAAELASV
jgi:phytanoyl-CoA hydroxylase